jgi:hypothetical protein
MHETKRNVKHHEKSRDRGETTTKQDKQRAFGCFTSAEGATETASLDKRLANISCNLVILLGHSIRVLCTQ